MFAVRGVLQGAQAERTCGEVRLDSAEGQGTSIPLRCPTEFARAMRGAMDSRG